MPSRAFHNWLLIVPSRVLRSKGSVMTANIWSTYSRLVLETTVTHKRELITERQFRSAWRLRQSPADRQVPRSAVTLFAYDIKQG